MKLKKLLSRVLILMAAGMSAFITTSSAQEATDTSIFDRVEVEAEYPGGTSAWIKYLQNNLNAHIPADRGAPVGRYTVIVQFIVDKDGSVSDIKPLTNLGYGMEQEVLRVIRLSGLWTPAMQDGRTVKAYRKQPVTFQLEEDGFEILSERPYTLYTNTDNELTIRVDKVKSNDLVASIPHGTIMAAGDGKFIVRVSKPGRITISVSSLKKGKHIGTASFEVIEK
jgi:hypothetical protein